MASFIFCGKSILKFCIFERMYLSIHTHQPLPSFAIFSSIAFRHPGPYLFIAQIAHTPTTSGTSAKIVNNQPFPIVSISGFVITLHTQLKMLRTKLLRATPLLDCRGRNSVSMVVTMAKMSMLPTPKKKPAIMGAAGWTPVGKG